MTTQSRRGPRPEAASRGRRHRAPANQVRHDDLTWSARVADHVTAVFGSWSFILAQSALILLWLAYNGYVAAHLLQGRGFDPYPFILLNLLFSTQAAYAAPLILLSQNRTAERDRVKAEHDFDVNILALRALAELLGDVRDKESERILLIRIGDLLGKDPDRQAFAGLPPPERNGLTGRLERADHFHRRRGERRASASAGPEGRRLVRAAEPPNRAMLDVTGGRPLNRQEPRDLRGGRRRRDPRPARPGVPVDARCKTQ